MNFSSSSAAASNDGINNSFQRLSVTQIAPTDIKKNIWTLKKAFKSVSLTRNSCLKPQHVPGSFGHFEQGVPLCEIFTDIGQKFLDRSKIVLARECLVRLESSAKFVQELEETVEKYMAYLDGERPIPSEFPFKVERFHDICHAAKTQCMYRLAIRKLIFSDPWLRKCVPDMLEDLEVVNKALSQLADTSISLISIILSCVLRLAEKCKWWLSQQGLSAVCQGIEDFNRLFEYTRNFQSDERELLSVSEIRNFVQSKGRETAVSTTAVSSVCLLSLNKLLNGVACERSRILAGHVYELVSEHQEVTRTLKYDFATNFEWKDFGVVCTGGNVRLEGGTLKNGVLSVLSRNQIPLLKLEPDSPLLSFDSEEQKFFSNLISQLATSTTLILSRHVSGERKNVIQLPPVEQLTSSSRSEDADLQGTSTAEEAGGSTSSLLHHQEGHGILRHSSSPGSPRLNKRVQWNAPLDSETTKQLHYDYSTMLWASFGEQLVALMAENQESIGNLTQNVALGPLFLWSDFLLMVVVRMMESLRLSGCLPPAGTSSLQAVSCYLHCLASASSWDSAFSGVLGSCLSDKCRMDSELTDSIPGTQTAQSIVSLLDPLESIFEMAGYWKRSSSHFEPHANRSARALTLSVFPSLCRFHSLLSFGFNWFDTKIHHFLSLWSLEQFLLLTQWDLPLFLQSVKKTFFLVQSLSAVHSDSISWNSLSVQYSLLQEQRSNLEGLLKKSWVLFSRDLTKMSTEFFQEAMPVGKSWKKSRHSGIPHQRSQYVEHAVFQILEPVVESSMGLSFESRLNVLTLVVNTMMESWSDFILKEEIVFSFYGAQQLSLDFGYIKVWIASDSSNLSSEIQSHLLKLDVFRHLDGAIGLLMLQPRKKKSNVEDNDGEFESNASTMSSSSVLSSLSGVDIDAYDIDVLNDKTIPNRQKWLDLRLRGGKSKKGLLPFCLKVQEMK